VDLKDGSTKFSDKEMKLAFQLIDTLTAKFQPEKFHDEYQANVEHLIKLKQKGERVQATAYKPPRAAVNILQALQKSLEENAGGKPVGRAKSRGRKAA
jgi:DNA end-binding protein Ku